MAIEALIRRFRQAAMQKGTFAVPAAKDHALHKAMAFAWWRLCTWVAPQLLAQGDEDGVAVLEAIAAKGGLDGFSAQMTLKEWKAGRLGSPLGDVGA